jgi:large subunit ribosomal protein L4
MQLDLTGAAANSNVEVADSAFACAYNAPLIHQVVTAYLAGARSGTRAQKTRGEVRGGGAKPWRQKGTGRARAGSSRNPIWRGGGVTFAARPNNYDQKVNRKSYRVALRSIVSELVRQERLVIVEEFVMTAPKTRELIGKLKELVLDNVLIVTENDEPSVELAARNLRAVGVRHTGNLDPVSLIGFDKVLITVPALRKLEERLV